MPFATARYPSIQLGLLQAILSEHEISAKTHYVNLSYGARLGWEVYEIFCRQTPRLLGDWIFAQAAFGGSAPDPWLYLDAYGHELEPFAARFGRGLDYLEKLRERDAPAFVEECFGAVAWDEYDVVGFTSTFAQNTAALALARLLKSRDPQLVTVFGGANFEDEMGVEYVRALPWIDYAVTGEGDIALPLLLECIASGKDTTELPGVVCRVVGDALASGRAPALHDLDVLPDPDYADYFATAAAVGLPAEVLRHPVKLPYESARGCWWGAKHHCTFCGLNGMGMTYRSKSPERVLAGFAELAERYGVRDFVSVDNILDMRYVGQVFGVLADRPLAYSFFHEVKANLKREQLELLARAGVTAIQPGIESLSTRLLRLMRKGVTGIQNVCLLKWAQHMGMQVLWNVLVGFPGERAEDYERQLEIIKLIPHLPPAYCGGIEVHRFSPYYTDAEALGVRDLRPDGAYGHIYPAALDFDRIAYFFEFHAETLPQEVHEPLYEHVMWWRRVWGRPGGPFLTYRTCDGELTVTDGRLTDVPPRLHAFAGAEALVHEFCGPIYHGIDKVAEHLREHGLRDARALAQGALDQLTALGLMLEDDGQYLSLALPEEPAFQAFPGRTDGALSFDTA
jgi:ribosomal peptide maturation radical SAM protein 1